MRLTLFLIFVSLTQVFALNSYSQATRISLNLKNSTVKDILYDIETKSEFYFLFNSQLIDVDRKVDIEVKNEKIENILEELFEGQDVGYTVVDRQIIIQPSSMVSETKMKLSKVITGKVTNESGEPIPGATVIIKGTSQGTISDVDGNYTLSNVPEDATLVFTFVGMKSLEIPVKGKNKINVKLVADSIDIEEVVAIGYGTMKKRDLTGSIASVKGEDIAEIPGATVTQALQGRTAGVLIQQKSGAPGADIQVRIRGNNSIKGSNEPLWVIDGFPVENANLLNLADIETIDVLKDASATAIYGSRGANGVIIVTTKRGKAGKTKIMYDGSFSVQSLRKKFDMLDAKEYMQLANIQNRNDFGSDYFTQEEINNVGETVDWQDLIYRTAAIQNHSLNMTGGNQKTKFGVGVSYFDQEGIIQNTDFKRITLRNNLEHEISKTFKVLFNVILSRTDNNEKDVVGGQRGGSILQASFAAPPTVGPYNDDGTYRRLNDEYMFMSSSFVNPVNYVNEISKKWFRNKVMSNLTLNITPIEGLLIKTSANVHNTEYRWDRYYSTKFQNSSGSAGIETVQVLELSTNNIISYEKTLGSHRFSIMGGSTYEQFLRTPFRTTGDGFIHDILETYDIGSAAVQGVPYSYYSKWKLLSFLGRLNYVYKDKYLATINFRSDGSSRYSEGKKWGYFPSGAFAWRASNENFMQNVDFISNLKFRLGFGVTGNTAISPYATMNLLSSVQAVFDKDLYSGFDPRNAYPGDLKWETTEQSNIGVDLGLFNNKIQIVADYYIKNTKDLLNDVQLSPSSGYTSTIRNIGKIQNKGFEVQLDAFLVDRVFKWNVSSNISFNRNKVVELSGGQDIPGSWYSTAWMGDYINLIREGEPFGVFYGYIEDGYDENGRVVYKDLDGEDGLTENDKTIIGDPNPDFIYSFDSRMSYKNFTFSFFFQGVQGNSIYSLSMGSSNYDYGWGLNTFKEVLYDHWTPENPNAKYPKITTTNTYQVSDRFVYDGSYLRLKNIELAYDIPIKNLGIQWMNKGQVYVSGQNLLTITSYPFWDPDVNSRGGDTSVNQGIDHFSYPTSKSVMFGVRLEF